MWYELQPAPARDADGYQDRALRAAAALQLSGRPSLLTPSDWLSWLRREDGVRVVASGDRRWVHTMDDGGRAARLIGEACSATPVECERPAILGEPLKWAHVLVPSSVTLARTARDEQSDGDEVRLDVPDGMVVVVNARRPGWVESMRLGDWLGDEFNRQADTSKLRAEGLGACRVSAGARTSHDSSRLVREAASALHIGFTGGLSSHPDMPGLLRRTLAVLLVPLALAGVLSGLDWWLMPVALALAVALFASTLRTPGVEWRRARHWWWLPRMRRARSSDLKTRAGGDDQNATGRDRKTRVHAYAWQRSTLPVPAGALMAVATPPSTRRSQVSALTARPDALRDADGPLVGLDAERRPVRLWEAASYGGIMLFGEPGGGKSNLMHGIVGHAAGAHRTGDVLVAFESKGADSLPVLRRLILGVHVVDLNDPTTPMIDLLGSGGPAERGARFADLMRHALGDQQIGPQSRIHLRDAVMVALTALASPDLTRRCNAAGVTPPATWVEGAARLLAAHGVADARALGRACALCGGEEARAAVERLHGPVSENGTPRVRDGELLAQLRAPMNKMDLLAQAPDLFAPGRRTVSFDMMLQASARTPDARLIVNLGPAERVDASGAHPACGDDTRQLVGALLFRGLRESVARVCPGWQDQGRHVRLFVDELSDVTGAGDGVAGGNRDIFEWFREKGRSFGVELTLGSQNPLQLDERLLASVTGFQTVGSFVLRSPVTAEPAARAVGVDPQRLVSLPRFAIALRTVGGPPDMATLPAMILHVPHFDGGEGL